MRFFLTLMFIFTTFFTSCNKTTKKMGTYNGIDLQILNIVDSMKICTEENPFITFYFTACNDSDNVVRVFEGVLIPPPPMPPLPIREVLISEQENFVGYKKYKDIYLVFIKSFFDGNFNKFVNKDSLCFDEEPFELFRVYEYETYEKLRKFARLNNCKPVEKRYLINQNDSLILYNGKCLFDID